MIDFALGQTFDVKFTTRRFSTGAPFTLAGSPAVAAYEDNNTTELTAGITLSVDFDSRTGLNNVRVVATSGNGYSAGKSYFLVITAGTVDSVSVVGEVAGEFTLERASFAQAAADKVWASATRTLTSLGTALVDEVFKRDLSAVTGEAARSLLNAVRAIRNKWSISGTTLTVTKEDDTTTAWTATLVESVGANPYSAQDPD
jgi:hypothetical protein